MHKRNLTSKRIHVLIDKMKQERLHTQHSDRKDFSLFKSKDKISLNVSKIDTLRYKIKNIKQNYLSNRNSKIYSKSNPKNKRKLCLNQSRKIMGIYRNKTRKNRFLKKFGKKRLIPRNLLPNKKLKEKEKMLLNQSLKPNSIRNITRNTRKKNMKKVQLKSALNLSQLNQELYKFNTQKTSSNDQIKSLSRGSRKMKKIPNFSSNKKKRQLFLENKQNFVNCYEKYSSVEPMKRDSLNSELELRIKKVDTKLLGDYHVLINDFYFKINKEENFYETFQKYIDFIQETDFDMFLNLISEFYSEKHFNVLKEFLVFERALLMVIFFLLIKKLFRKEIHFIKKLIKYIKINALYFIGTFTRIDNQKTHKISSTVKQS